MITNRFQAEKCIGIYALATAFSISVSMLTRAQLYRLYCFGCNNKKKDQIHSSVSHSPMLNTCHSACCYFQISKFIEGYKCLFSFEHADANRLLWIPWLFGCKLKKGVEIQNCRYCRFTEHKLQHKKIHYIYIFYV